MTMHVIEVQSSSSHALGFIQMSAESARAFLTDLRSGRSPTVATGDEGGTVEIRYEDSGSGPTFLVHRPGGRDTPRCWAMDRTFDIKLVAEELLADLGL